MIKAHGAWHEAQGAKMQGARSEYTKSYQLDTSDFSPRSSHHSTASMPRTLVRGARRKELGARRKELGARRKERGARRKELGARRKERGARRKGYPGL